MRADLHTGLGSANEEQRWKAARHLGEFVERAPEAVWGLVAQWGCSDHEDTRAAVASCVLEHLLEHHFASVFPRVEELALADARFADTFCWCWRFGQSDKPANAARFESLKARLVARGAQAARTEVVMSDDIGIDADAAL